MRMFWLEDDSEVFYVSVEPNGLAKPPSGPADAESRNTHSAHPRYRASPRAHQTSSTTDPTHIDPTHEEGTWLRT